MCSTMRSVAAFIILIFNFIEINCLYTNYNADGTFMYFAYGSNLLGKRIRINNPSSVFYGTAKLEDYRLDFNIYAETWNGAVATIVEDPGEVVWGDLWSIDISKMHHLDKQEGVDVGWYYPKNVTVKTPDGREIVARTYIETNNPPKLKVGEALPMERRPSNTYFEVIVLGAVQSQLPPDYIESLFAFPTNGKFAPVKTRKSLGYPFNSY